jgi:hypothetical protein
MSVNLDISFEIHNIAEIHEEEREVKRDAIYEAAKTFLTAEGILDQDMIVDFLGQEGYLAAYTTYPLVISRSYVWVPDVTKRWEDMAKNVLGATCDPKVVVEYPDEAY